MKYSFRPLLSLLLVTFAAAPARAAAPYTTPVAASFATAVPASRQSLIALQGSDAEGTSLTYATTSSPSHGALSNLNTATGYVVYTPTNNYTGSDSFTYTVTSGGETSSAGTVTLSVTNAKTTVSEVLSDPSGNPRAGKVTFILTQLVTSPAGITPVGSSVSAALDSSGRFSAQLYPSRSLSPAAYYQVWFNDATTLRQELLGVYDLPAATTTVTLSPYRVTDTNLAARYVFASEAAVSAIAQAVSSATLATLTLGNITAALGYTPVNAASLGTMSAQNANSVAITGGTATNLTCVGCTNLGTGTAGGVANTGDTVLASDTDVSGGGDVDIQTGGVSRLKFKADGTVVGAGKITKRFDVTDYGAKGDGSTNDTSAFNAAIAACNSAGGGVVYAPRPTSYYKVTSATTTITAPCTVRGDGSGSSPSAVAWTTKIVQTSRTANLFTVSADSASFEGLYLFNSNSTYGVSGAAPATPPTAGAGISVVATSSSTRVNITDCVVEGFYNDVVQDGAHWAIDRSHLINPVNYSLSVSNTVNIDAGDWSVVGSFFTSKTYMAPAAIRIVGAGGGKIAACKFNTYDDPAISGATGYTDFISVNSSSTAILLITGNSLENVSRWSVDVTNYLEVNVTGNQFGHYIAGSQAAVQMIGTADSVIEGNIFRGSVVSGWPAVALANCSKCLVGGGNLNSGFGVLVQRAGTYSTGGPTYEAPTLLNSWANTGGSLETAGYALHGGTVYLKGTLTSPGTPTATMWTLPAGLRPAADMIFPGTANGGFQRIRVYANGNVQAEGLGASGVPVSVDGIKFVPAP